MIKVKDTTPDGQAFKIGLRKGDVILSIADRSVTSTEEFTRETIAARAFNSVSIEWRRDGQNFEGKLDVRESLGLIVIDDYSVQTTSEPAASFQVKTPEPKTIAQHQNRATVPEYGFARLTSVVLLVISIFGVLVGGFYLLSYFGKSSYSRVAADLIYGLLLLVSSLITLGVSQALSAVLDSAQNSYRILNQIDQR